MVTPAGSAYLVRPPAGSPAGVLVLHSWWGLTPFMRSVCDRLSDLGYVALAPDLLDGARPTTPDEAQAVLQGADINNTAGLVLSSARSLRALTTDDRAPIAVVGFSMGASWAYWLATRSAQEVAAVVGFYGMQSGDLSAAQAVVQAHFAEFDEFASAEQIIDFEMRLLAGGRDAELWHYEGTSHWFFEEDRAPAYDPDAAALAWERVVAFLRTHHPTVGRTPAPGGV
ncbi:MAG: dienelactone hydrolase family protein [Actinobacteria bacterium]|nr:dienelactone hydrolase family protein [Actinomycetota bacterium]